MSRNKLSKWIGMVAIAAVLFAGAQASAQTTYVWQIADTDSNWNDAGAWSPAVADANVGADGVGNRANILLDIDPNYDPVTISLNGLDITLGILQMGDGSTGGEGYTIAAGGGTLTFDSGLTNADPNLGLPLSDPNGNASLLQSWPGAVSRIEAPIKLMQSLNVNVSHGAMTLAGGIEANDPAINFSKDGADRVYLECRSNLAGTAYVNTGSLFITESNSLGTATIEMAGGRLYSVALTDADADHSQNNVVLAADARISGMQGYGDNPIQDDPNQVTHKFGGLSLAAGVAEATLYVSAWGSNNDVVEFTGTTTLDGNINLAPYDEFAPLHMSGEITGSGMLGIIPGNAGRTILSADNNFTGGLTFYGGYLVLAAPNAAGAGPITFVHQEQYNTRINLVAETDAQGDHSSTDVILSGAAQANKWFGFGGGQGFNTNGTLIDDANVIIHKLGGLTFTEDAQVLFWNSGDILEFTGTVTLDGNSHINPYYNTTSKVYVSGQVTGSGNLIMYGGQLTLSNDTNNYSGETRVDAGALILAAPDAASTGDVVLNGGSLRSVGVDQAQVEHLNTDVVLQTSGNIGVGTYVDRAGILVQDANLITLVHKFGDLTFAQPELRLTLGDNDSSGRSMEFTGTVTLDGNTEFYSGWAHVNTTLSGDVTGNGTLIRPAGWTRGYLILAHDTTYTGGTVVANNLALSAPNAAAGDVYLDGGALFSLGTDQAQVEHVNTNLIVNVNSTVIGTTGFNAPTWSTFYDANFPLQHKFGDLTFTQNAQTFTWTGDAYGAHGRITGTTTLVGDSAVIAYVCRLYLDGVVTGSGKLIAALGNTSGSVYSVVLTNNNNNYTDGTLVPSSAKLIITAPNAIPGTVELSNSYLYSIGVTDEQADHSSTNILLTGGTHYLSGGEVLRDTTDAPGNDSNLAVQHTFGDLTFTMNGQSLTWYGSQDGDFGHIAGTTTLVEGDNTVLGNRSRLFLDGVVTGSGKLIINGSMSGGVNSVVLSSNNNYTGGTEAYGENVIITAPNAIPGSIELNGRALYSVAVTGEQADHSATDIVLRASSTVQGGQSLSLITDVPLDDPNIKLTHKFGGVTWGTDGLRLTVGGDDNPGWDVVEFTGMIYVNETNCYLRSYRGTALLSGPITGSGHLGIVSTDGSKGVFITGDNNNRAGETTIGGTTVMGAPNSLTGTVNLTSTGT
ncbi:MAG TPA: hypothetical protein VNA25_12465, partial [Phycisphaerae bacterium]|nr:hypothetical protein [Phycisphaerae bacterium]